MSNKRFLERKTISESTAQAKYSAGNSIYIVSSYFSGNEHLENLLFNILHNKSLIKNNESMARA